MQYMTFEPIAGPFVLIVIAGILCGLVFVRPGFLKMTRQQRIVLACLRSLAVLLTLTALVRPGCVTQIEKPKTGVVEIFVDKTRSMQLPHRASGESRFEVMRAMIDRHRGKLEQLEENNIRVRWFMFDNQINEVEITPSSMQFPDEATGEETDIGTSLFRGTELVRNQTLLATVLASDGVQNALDPDTELNDAVRSLAQMQVPLFVIPFGQADQSNQLADLAITNLVDQYSVRVNNNLRVTATLQARGFAGEQIPVQLVIVNRDGTERVVDTQRIDVERGFEERTVSLNYVPTQSGQFQMLVRAQPQQSESAVANNQLPSFLTVDDRGINVLFLYGNLRWEQKFIRTALRSDSVITIDAWAIDHRSQRSWPLDVSSRISDPKYDVIIFADVDSRSIYDETFMVKNMDALTEAISNSKGFAMLGGKHSFGPGLYHTTPLVNYLPVEMEPFEIQPLDEPTRMDLHISGPFRVKPSRSHFVTRIGTGIRGGSIWEELPPMNIANRFLGVKDTARTLMVNDSGEPMMVISTVGGRVMAVAFDGTWMWRNEYSEATHNRFWRQVILWLAGQDGLAGDDVWISMPQRRFQLGQTVDFTAGITSANEEDIGNAALTATLVAPDGTETEIEVLPNGENWSAEIAKQLMPDAGFYRIAVEARTPDKELGSTETEFVVFDNDREKAVTSAAPRELDLLARQTEEWGGRTVLPDEFGALLDEIAEKAPANSIEIPRRWRLGDTWQDALGFVLAFVFILTLEWVLRKKWGMV